MSARRLLAIGLGAMAIGAAAAPLPVEGAFAGFDGATTWLNGTPLTRQALRGKVVLVDFWTYSCINCIRTLPYIRAWAERYRDQGLVVVGVHTPEFRFEQDLANVNAAIGRFGIDFPVAVDSDQRIWRAWNNRYWPAYYLVDAAGRVRYHQFGEGDYARTEQAIQSLLAEARGGAPMPAGFVNPVTPGEQRAPDLASLASGETYVGYRKAEHFRSAERVAEDRPRDYSVGALALNQWGLAGRWIVGAESAVADAPDARIAYRFSARDLHLVLGPGAAGRPVRIRVTLDGRPPGADHGTDVDADGNGVVTATRLYQLVRQSGKVRARRFEVRFPDRGAEAYAFTFG
jgi:thiol-disulfide isomerase/thioredoxin